MALFYQETNTLSRADARDDRILWSSGDGATERVFFFERLRKRLRMRKPKNDVFIAFSDN